MFKELNWMPFHDRVMFKTKDLYCIKTILVNVCVMEKYIDNLIVLNCMSFKPIAPNNNENKILTPKTRTILILTTMG